MIVSFPQLCGPENSSSLDEAPRHIKLHFPNPIRCEEGEAELGRDGTDYGTGWCCAKWLNVGAGPATPTLVLRRFRTTTNKGPPSPRQEAGSQSATPSPGLLDQCVLPV